MANETNNKKKKNSGWWIWLVFVGIGALANAAEDMDLQRLWLRFRVNMLRRGWDLSELGQYLPMLATAAVIVVALVAVTAAVKSAARRRAEVSDRRPAAARTSAAVQRRDPRTKSFTQPDPYCVVCDHSGEDHFRHDREQRIRQLDEWLKNGLIDREEYRVLKSRFERDL